MLEKDKVEPEFRPKVTPKGILIKKRALSLLQNTVWKRIYSFHCPNKFAMKNETFQSPS